MMQKLAQNASKSTNVVSSDSNGKDKGLTEEVMAVISSRAMLGGPYDLLRNLSNTCYLCFTKLL